MYLVKKEKKKENLQGFRITSLLASSPKIVSVVNTYRLGKTALSRISRTKCNFTGGVLAYQSDLLSRYFTD